MKELREKVKTLCLQDDPSNTLILSTGELGNNCKERKP